MPGINESNASRIAWLAVTGIAGAGLVYFGKTLKSSLLRSAAITVGSGMIVKSLSQTIIGGLLKTEE